MARKRTTTRGRHRPFASKEQWRLFFVSPRLRRFARAKAHATPGGPKTRYRRLPRYSPTGRGPGRRRLRG